MWLCSIDTSGITVHYINTTICQTVHHRLLSQKVQVAHFQLINIISTRCQRSVIMYLKQGCAPLGLPEGGWLAAIMNIQMECVGRSWTCCFTLCPASNGNFQLLTCCKISLTHMQESALDAAKMNRFSCHPLGKYIKYTSF